MPYWLAATSVVTHKGDKRKRLLDSLVNEPSAWSKTKGFLYGNTRK
jgi:hypothetical protein